MTSFSLFAEFRELPRTGLYAFDNPFLSVWKSDEHLRNEDVHQISVAQKGVTYLAFEHS